MAAYVLKDSILHLVIIRDVGRLISIYLSSGIVHFKCHK